MKKSPAKSKNVILTQTLVQAAAEICEEKKGLDTRILVLDPADSGLSDYFLITSATNDRQATAIADEIELRLKRKYGVMPNSVEGRRKGDWILLDYVDFVVHVFRAERRAFYSIERLRKSARPLSPQEFPPDKFPAKRVITKTKNTLTPETKTVAKRKITKTATRVPKRLSATKKH